MPSQGSRTPTVFVSYSHRDAAYLERLQVHLKPLRRDGVADLWDDTRITPGQEWQREIAAAVDRASVAVLLISADFLASDFIHSNELPQLLVAAKDTGVIILPIVVKPCGFTRHPELSKFQAVNSPDKPLIGLPEVEQEAIWDKVARIVADAQRDHVQVVIQSDTSPADITLNDIRYVASKLAGSSVLGDLVALGIDVLGVDGLFMLQRSTQARTTLDIFEGILLEEGYVSAEFVTEPERALAVLDEPYVLVCAGEISTREELHSNLVLSSLVGNPLVVIAEEISITAMDYLIELSSPSHRVVAVRAPSYGKQNLELLRDIAILTDARVLNAPHATQIQNATLYQLGRAQRVVVGDDFTNLIGGQGSVERVKARIGELKEGLRRPQIALEHDAMQRRLANLAGGRVVMNVGGVTDEEMESDYIRLAETLGHLRSWFAGGERPSV